jgi:hypothetical protein
MYGLSLIAALLEVSAARRVASATRRARSALTDAGAGAGDPDGPGVGDALAGFAGTGTGAAITVAAKPTAFFFIAATLAATSALFWAMRSAPES